VTQDVEHEHGKESEIYYVDTYVDDEIKVEYGNGTTFATMLKCDENRNGSS
jgi:hypothetical protein